VQEIQTALLDVWAYSPNTTRDGPRRNTTQIKLSTRRETRRISFYIHRGKVKLPSFPSWKEAVVAIRGPDEFCGEGAMTGTR